MPRDNFCLAITLTARVILKEAKKSPLLRGRDSLGGIFLGDNLGEGDCESRIASRQWGDNFCRETSRCRRALWVGNSPKICQSTQIRSAWGESKGCLSLIKGCPHSTPIPKAGILKTGIPKVGKTPTLPETEIPKPKIPKSGIPSPLGQG